MRAIARRLALAVPLLFLVSALTFLFESLIPGDPAREILGYLASPQQAAQLRHTLGFDMPVYEQYWRWLDRAVHGDLGNSLGTQGAASVAPVLQAAEERAPVTLSLMGGALLVSVIAGVGLGVLSAVRGGWLGRAVDAFSMVGWIFPIFWIAAELIVVGAVQLRWFPATGYVALSESPSEWLRSLVLPVIALSVGPIGGIAKQTREAMLDALSTEYVRMAWANGVPARSIYFRHALKNASLRIVTVMGLLAVGLLVGTVFVETVFALPGLGGLLVSACLAHDLPVVQGISVIFTVAVILINLATDICYTLLNPKVRLA